MNSCWFFLFHFCIRNQLSGQLLYTKSILLELLWSYILSFSPIDSTIWFIFIFGTRWKRFQIKRNLKKKEKTRFEQKFRITEWKNFWGLIFGRAIIKSRKENFVYLDGSERKVGRRRQGIHLFAKRGVLYRSQFTATVNVSAFWSGNRDSIE